MRSSHRQSFHTPHRADTRLVHVKALLPRPNLNRIHQVEGLDTEAQEHQSQEIFPDQRSGQAKTMRAEIQRVSRRRYNILITGATGTGKTYAAREIHRHSVRCNAPFMELNCANLPEQLVEAELFGYRNGAFTGADRDHMALFEEANGGILFLDEIGDIPLTLQNRLLKAIEEKGNKSDIWFNATPSELRLPSLSVTMSPFQPRCSTLPYVNRKRHFPRCRSE